MLEVAPNGHKTCPERHCGKFTIFAQANGLEQLEPSRFLPVLPLLLQAYRAAGRHVTTDSPVFVKTKGGGHRFTDTPCTNGVVITILKKRSAAVALGHEHFTGHSFRRGRMQDDQDAGVPPRVTQARALGIGDATYNLYTDRTRPTRQQKPPTEKPDAHFSNAAPAAPSMLTRVANAIRGSLWAVQPNSPTH